MVQLTLPKWKKLNENKDLSWPAGSVKQLDAEHDLVMWIISAMKPYTVVSNEHFITFITGMR